jgi:hypothetical protein
VYRPTLSNYRHKIKLMRNERSECEGHIMCSKIKDNKNGLLDTSGKEYDLMEIFGFSCNFENSIFEDIPSFLGIITADLEMLSSLLPRKACRLLQKDTVIWINKSITYGPVDDPIVGLSMCYHARDGQDWLSSMGMRLDKAGGIEIYSAEEYLKSRNLWGVGGLLVHEFSHAYHNKFCKDGYENEKILDAYNIAMSRKLYDCVPVHGKQGIKKSVKSYACYNCMEFFAELSVAFLWQEQDGLNGCQVEYNKWYPHNFTQLYGHDIDSCYMLAKAWGISLKNIFKKNSLKNIPEKKIIQNIAENVDSLKRVPENFSELPEIKLKVWSELELRLELGLEYGLELGLELGLAERRLANPNHNPNPNRYPHLNLKES